jgi:hypothetical protein
MSPIAKPQVALLLSALCSLCLCGSSSAADPEATTPYPVKVVLKVAENRLFTPVFRERLRSELRDSLQAALGAMGEVEVIDLVSVAADKRPPLWNDVEAKGLQQALDGGSKGTGDAKTHFVFVDYVDGQYEIQARQHDGLTGLASPAVRRDRTADRQFVARTAALLVDRDFGLVGTVLDASNPEKVRVAFKGGGLGVPLDRWVKKDDVFALVQVSGGRAARVPWTLLQVQQPPGDDGTGSFRLLQGRPRPLPGGDYRCLKLGTTRGPVRLRLVKNEPPNYPPATNVPIQVRQHGFADDDKVEGATDLDGYFTTEKKKVQYEGVAYVSVLYAGDVRAQVPVAVVDDRPITLPVNLSADAASQLLVRRKLWEQDLLDKLVYLSGLFSSLNESKPQEQKLATAQKAMEGLNNDITNFVRERKELAAAPPPPGGKPLDLAAGDAYLQDVQKGRDQLLAFANNLEKALKDESDPARQEARALLGQARLLEEGEAEYGKAIELYDKALALAEDAKLKERLARLKDAWKPKNDAHAEARAFIYQAWPKMGPGDMKEGVKEARKALEECKRVKDPLGPRRLLKVATGHAAQMTKQLEGLAPDVNEDDHKLALELTATLDDLARLIKETSAYVGTVTPP